MGARGRPALSAYLVSIRAVDHSGLGLLSESKWRESSSHGKYTVAVQERRAARSTRAAEAMERHQGCGGRRNGGLRGRPSPAAACKGLTHRHRPVTPETQRQPLSSRTSPPWHEPAALPTLARVRCPHSEDTVLAEDTFQLQCSQD